MRLLRDESLDLLVRGSGQPAGANTTWREEFLAAGREGLKSHPAPVGDVALREAQRKVGELSIELDIRQGPVGALGVATKQVVVGPLPNPLDWRALAEGAEPSPEVVSLKPGRKGRCPFA